MMETMDANSSQASTYFSNPAFVPDVSCEDSCLDVNVTHNITRSKRSADVATQTPNHTVCESQSDNRIIWKIDAYYVPITKGFLELKSAGKKQILHPMSGILFSGSVMALMGPSGAGKTTLLNIISGMTAKNVTGQVFITGYNCHRRNMRIGFVPQVEHLFMEFTVEETVMFASRLNNGSFSIRDHEEKVEQTLNNFDIHDNRHDKLKVLSGGQLKRTSIAVELVSNPAILMLDEPTTGLDSDNAETVVRLLKNLTKTDARDAPAIIATIHQPSSDTFMLFDQIYLLSRNGHHIFSGAPTQVMDHFDSFGFQRKRYTNPAEYMIEIANAKYGDDKFTIMSQAANEMEVEEISRIGEERRDLKDLETEAQIPPLEQFKLIFWRNFLSYFVKTRIGLSMMMGHLIFCAVFVHMTDILPGKVDGCYPSLKNYTLMKNHSSFFETINDKMWDFDVIELMRKGAQNSMIPIILMTYFNLIAILTSVTFYAREVKMITREISNHWYSINSYFLAKIWCNLFHLILTTTPAVAYTYFVGGYPADEWWRFGLVLLTLLMICHIWESRTFCFAIIFHEHPIIALMIMCLLSSTLGLNSGFCGPIVLMKDYVQRFGDLSDLKFGLDALLLSLFGFDRCKPSDGFISNNLLLKRNLKSTVSEFSSLFHFSRNDGRKFSLLLGLDEKFMDPVIGAIKQTVGSYVPDADDGDLQPSFLMNFLNLNQEDFARDIIILAIHIVFAHISLLMVLKFMSRRNK